MGFRQFVKKVPVWARIVVVLVVVAGIALIGVNIYLTNLVNKRLRQMVTETSHGLYKLDYSKASVNALTGSVSFHNVSLIPDSIAFATLRQLHAEPHYLAGGKTQRLALKNVHWLSYLNSKKLSIGEVLIENPEFDITQFNRKDSSKQSLNIYDFLSKEVKELHIGMFSISNAVINYQIADTTEKARTVNKIENLDLSFIKIHFSEQQKLVADDYRVQLKEYKHRTADSLYWIGLSGFDYNSKQQKLKLHSFFVQPRYSDKEFSSKLKEQETVYKMNLHDIAAEGFDMSLLTEKGQAIVNEVRVGKGDVDIFMDRALPKPAEDQKNVSISQKIVNMGFPFMIHLLKLGNVDMTYREFETLTDRTAKIAFDNVSGQATNITSIPEFIDKNHLMKVALNCSFLKSPVNVRFEFNLAKEDGSFTSWLKASQLEAHKLNPILAPVAKIEARKGTLKYLEATVHGNENNATANVNLQYEGLKIDILKLEGDSLTRKGLPSVFANILIMDDNPKDGVLRTANGVSIKRGFGRSFFNMVWLSVSTGITQILAKKKGLKLG